MAQLIEYSFWGYFLRNIAERRKTQLRKKCNNNIIALQGSKVLMETHIGVSLLRALYFGMTNLKMQCINYSVMNLLKRLRVCCTVFFGALGAKLGIAVWVSLFSMHNTRVRQSLTNVISHVKLVALCLVFLHSHMLIAS